jgi:hypothetical protein
VAVSRAALINIDPLVTWILGVIGDGGGRNLSHLTSKYGRDCEQDHVWKKTF